MYEATPNPPYASSATSSDLNLQAAAQRAIEHHLPPSDDGTVSERPSGTLFLVNPTIDPETLLANAAENLASANQTAATLAFDLEDPHRAIILGIHQLIDLSALLIARAQEQVAPAANPAALPQGGNLNPCCHRAKFHNSLRIWGLRYCSREAPRTSSP